MFSPTLEIYQALEIHYGLLQGVHQVFTSFHQVLEIHQEFTKFSPVFIFFTKL